MQKILILPAVALLGAAAGEAAGQEPDCGSFQASITGADTREVQGGMATIRTLEDRPFTHLDLRAAVPGADSVLVLSFSRHSAMPAAGDYAISSAAASGETFSGSYLRVRRAGGIVGYNGITGTMILSAVENGKVRGDFELAARTGDEPAAEVRVRGTFTALTGHRAEACQFAAGRVGAPAGLPGAPLLAGRGSLRRTPTAGPAPRRPPAPGEAPFGLRMGTKLSELVRHGLTPRDMDMGIYQLARVPQRDARFRDHLVMVSLAEGLCRVTALTGPVSAAGDGAALKEAFARLEASLRETYGASSRTDYLREGSTLSAPRQWMAALHRGERTLSTFWLPDTGAALSPELRGIELQANATSATSGFVSVHYEFANFPACQREAEQARLRSNPSP